MSQFRTIVDIPEYPFNISYKDKIMFIGSCFSDNIGSVLKRLKFNVNINPFGALYNPVSVKNSLELLINNRQFTKNDIQKYDEMWFSFYHHSNFSDVDKNKCLDRINKSISEASRFLREAAYLFITWGTARVYELESTGQVISNCHKLPAKYFRRKLPGFDEIVDLNTSLFKQLRNFNPNLEIICTISPVRHWKDGAHGNQVSKSMLHIALHELTGLANVFYFPAYEIAMDDLRDYRFYEADMLHLNQTAVNYIWDKFKTAFLDENTVNLMQQIEKLVKNSEHKPFNHKTESFRKFVNKNLTNIRNLSVKYPHIDFSEEETFFNSVYSKT